MKRGSLAEDMHHIITSKISQHSSLGISGDASTTDDANTDRHPHTSYDDMGSLSPVGQAQGS